MSKVEVEVRLPVEAIAELDRLADGIGMTREKLVLRILKTYVKKRLGEPTPADKHGFEPFDYTERS